MTSVLVTGAAGKMGALSAQTIAAQEDLRLVALVDPKGADAVGDAFDGATTVEVGDGRPAQPASAKLIARPAAMRATRRPCASGRSIRIAILRHVLPETMRPGKGLVNRRGVSVGRHSRPGSGDLCAAAESRRPALPEPSRTRSRHRHGTLGVLRLGRSVQV